MMRALKTFTYDGRTLHAGDLFELMGRGIEGDRRVLIAAELAEDVMNGSEAKNIKKRTYKRRDLQAEDE